MQTRKKVTDCACGQSRGSGPIHRRYGTRLCTFRPAGCVPASPTLRNEGERPTGYTEAMAAAMGVPRVASRAPAALTVADIDRKVTYFHPKIKGSIYLGNPMETCKKVTGLWTVTRNGPRILPSSLIWLVEMYISTCWLPRRLSDAQRRGRTTHWVCRGDGGGRCPPRARTRRLARHLCRQHRSESDRFLPDFSVLILHRKSNGNQCQPGKKWPACGQSRGMGPIHR